VVQDAPRRVVDAGPAGPHHVVVRPEDVAHHQAHEDDDGQVAEHDAEEEPLDVDAAVVGAQVPEQPRHPQQRLGGLPQQQ